MLSSIFDGGVVFLHTEDDVTLLSASEQLLSAYAPVSSAANNMHSQQALLDSGDDMLQ